MVWVLDLTTELHEAWEQSLIAPCQSHCNLCRHLYQEFNGEADALATEGLTLQLTKTEFFSTPAGMPVCLQAAFDGGRRGSNAGSGWLLWGTWSEDKKLRVKLAQGRSFLGDKTTIHAELHGATQALHAALDIVTRGWQGSFIGARLGAIAMSRFPPMALENKVLCVVEVARKS